MSAEPRTMCFTCGWDGDGFEVEDCECGNGCIQCCDCDELEDDNER